MRAPTLRFTGFTAAVVLIGSLAAGLTALPHSKTPMVRLTTADVMTVDMTHSGITFRVTHLGVSYVPGRFNAFDGSFTFDPENLEACAIAATAKAASIDTNSSGRDRHLKSPDFFDAENHPDVTFQSTKWEQGADKDTFRVTGDLTLLGKTKSITIELQHVGTKTAARFGKRIGLYTEFTVNRSEFGMNYGLDGAVNDEVQISVAFEGAEPRQ